MNKQHEIEELIEGESWRQLFDLHKNQLSDLLRLADNEETNGDENQYGTNGDDLFNCRGDAMRRPRSRERARLILTGLRHAETRAALCELAMEKESKWLNELLQTTKYVPDKTELKAAFYVITNQWDKYLQEFGLQGHGDLLNSIATGGSTSEKILSQIERTSELSCVKFILELFFDKAAQEFSFKTKSGNSSRFEPRLQAVLFDLSSDDCRVCVCEKWLESRDTRLTKIIRNFRKDNWLPAEPLKLQLYVGLKFGGLNKRSLNIAAVEILIEACRDEDKEIRDAAAEALVSLTNSEAQNEVLDRLLGKKEKTRHNDPGGSMGGGVHEHPDAEYEERLLERLVPRIQYRPRAAADLALFAVLLKDWDGYVKADPDGSILQFLYAKANIRLRQSIADGLKESARFDWIVNVCGPQGKIKLSEMTELDWQLLQKTLSANSSWEELWNLVPVLPASSARKFIQRLAQVGWQPKEEEDRQRFERLLSYSKRLNTEHPKIWSDAGLWKVIDIGGNLFDQLHGGASMWESRFSFAHDGSEFFMIDRYGDLRSWGLPSCLPGRMHIEGLRPLSAICASPRAAVMALGEIDGSVWLCDLDGRRVLQKLRHDNYSDAIPTRISYLKFSQNGSYLQGIQRSPDKPGCCNSLSWLTESWQKTTHLLPPYSEVSLDNQLLLYKNGAAVVLEQMDGKRSQLASSPTSFRTGAVEFLPNSRAVLRKEGGRLKVLNIPNLKQVDEAVCPNFSTFMISDYASHKIVCLNGDFSWTFFDNPYASNEKAQKPEQDPFFFFNQTLQHDHSHFALSDSRPSSLRRRSTEASIQALVDAGVNTGHVNDIQSMSVSYSVFQGLKDTNTQYFAIVHATGKVSFWVSSLFKYAQKSAALMNEEDFNALAARLSAPETSDSEKHWISFILELAGSYEHCAISISESGGNNYLELAKFDIELA